MGNMKQFRNGAITLFGGDSRDILKEMPDNCIDSIVTDPPYALVSIVKRFGKPGSAPAKGNEAFMRASKGFMGKEWDTGEVAFDPEFWIECIRVLKPGGHLLSFGGTRTYHRMACAIEDAGFEIRDMMQWLYGSGFPKSHDVSKGIDKAAGVERTIKTGVKPGHEGFTDGNMSSVQSLGGTMGGEGGFERPWMSDPDAVDRYHHTYAPATDDAKQWEGWGTALKPANEPIVLARKPLSEKTVAANVLKWGTGAINIDGCRVGTEERTYDLKGGENLNKIAREGSNDNPDAKGLGSYGVGAKQVSVGKATVTGRFPANVITDGSDEVVAEFPESKGQQGDLKGHKTKRESPNGVFGKMAPAVDHPARGDSGSAARFFYQAKANKKDRADSKHPTVKPIKLLRYLIRLITPPGGIVMDPFAGSGTTGEAAYMEGCQAILIEREAEYQADIAHRFDEIKDAVD